MNPRSIAAFSLALLLILCSPILAQDSDDPFGLDQRGPGQGDPTISDRKPRGPGRGKGPMAEFRQDAEVKKIMEQMQNKRRELFQALSADQWDEAQAKKIHHELMELRNFLDNKRFEHLLAFKKKNPDWQPQPPRRGMKSLDRFQGRKPSTENKP